MVGVRREDDAKMKRRVHGILQVCIFLFFIYILGWLCNGRSQLIELCVSLEHYIMHICFPNTPCFDFVFGHGVQRQNYRFNQ